MFRLGFGLMMALSIVRFWANGWIEKLYLTPDYFFSYRYFEWVKPLGSGTYVLFLVALVSALMVMIGWKYRLAIILFFLSFTYIELMDKTTYLNHYYFISLLSFVLIWLPAGDYYSVDARKRPPAKVPAWTILSLQAFVAVVYVYAGLAKLNSDWLLEAQPLATWLPAKYSLPLLGDLLQQRWVHYAFSWSGAGYDLLIPFFLWWRPTRTVAFALVVVFHVLTRVLFPIGMFPYIMIVSALVFFDAGVHEKIIAFLRRAGHLFSGDAGKVSGSGADLARTQVQGQVKQRTGSFSFWVVSAVLLLHLLLPWRYLLHPGELFWTEAGYRFSWRVMLMEKAGYLTYTLKDRATGKQRVIDPSTYLTAFQAKQLSTQPDFILEFAHYLAQRHRRADGSLPAVYAESYVALNGRSSQPYVNPDIDLTTVTFATPRQEWLMPFEDVIYGL